MLELIQAVDERLDVNIVANLKKMTETLVAFKEISSGYHGIFVNRILLEKHSHHRILFFALMHVIFHFYLRKDNRSWIFSCLPTILCWVSEILF